jgi:anti-sigma B factor antagonist
MIVDLSTRHVDPDIIIFELSGRLTLGNRLTEIEHSIKTAIESGCRKLVLDLGQLDFIDSAGVGMLVMCAGAMGQAGGRMCVATRNPRIVHVFEVTHLERVVALHADAGSACQSLGTTGTAAAS